MRKIFSLLLVLQFTSLLVSCSYPNLGLSNPTATPTRPSATPTTSPAFTQPSQPFPPTSSPIAPTNTALPTPSLAPPSPVSFYRLRLTFTSSSDWASVDLPQSPDIMAIRIMATAGSPTFAEATTAQLNLNQPIAKAERGLQVSLAVDLALAESAAQHRLDFTLHKGDIGECRLEFSLLAEDQTYPLGSYRHAGVVSNSQGTNPKVIQPDLSSLSSHSPTRVDVHRPGVPRMLWAFFYMWYSRSDWGSPWLQDHPLQAYASAERATIARQIEQAQSAGIDGFISSWWGPGSDTDRNLRTLLDEAQARNFKVSIYFETLAGENGSPLSTSEIERWLAYFIQQYRDHPALVRLDGLPVIVLWASDTVPKEDWARVFASLQARGQEAVYLSIGYNPANLDVFDGLHEYGVFGIPDLRQAVLSTSRAVRYYNLLADEPSPKLWVATVQPGYDDTLLPGREGLVQPRLDGDFYRRTWEIALESDPDWIFISTWNEWWEHTYIEPSEDFGELYLEITREYAQGWK